MPFISWSGSYVESCPMRTTFVANADYKYAIIATLQTKGYSEHLHPFLIAAF